MMALVSKYGCGALNEHNIRQTNKKRQPSELPLIRTMRLARPVVGRVTPRQLAAFSGRQSNDTTSFPEAPGEAAFGLSCQMNMTSTGILIA